VTLVNSLRLCPLSLAVEKAALIQIYLNGETTMKNYHEFCADVVKQLFNIIDEKSSLLSWCKEWSSQATLALPQGINGIYSGMNLFKLLSCQHIEGFTSSEWLTYLQVQKLGGNIRKGARGTKILFYKLVESSKNDDPDDSVIQPCVRLYTVFNREQTTLDTLEIAQPFNQNRSIGNLISHHKIAVEHYGSRAYYNTQDDVIVMPNPSTFSNDKAYYTTLLHEIVHWSGSTNRLSRGSLKHYATSKVMRAEEELVAEIGSVFLAMHFGITGDLENHASYISDWKCLLSTQNVTSAISAAGKAFHWLIDVKQKVA
jgi:antirestriction protein ArdC